MVPSVPTGDQINARQQQNNLVSLCTNIGSTKRHGQVLLSMAEVMVNGQNNSTIKCRALFDSRADSSIITEKASKLKLKMDREDLPVCDLNDIQTRVNYLLSTKIIY